MRKICFITGTRAEYGLLKPLIDGFILDDNYKIQIIATGMHLSPELGLTHKEISLKESIKWWGHIKYYYVYNSRIEGEKTMNVKREDTAPMIKKGNGWC